MRFKHLFGPVNSRRLGISLGVDLVPYKYCPQNCVYCEVQQTTHLVEERQEFFPVLSILEELDAFLEKQPELDYITFSGAGEPTLYSALGSVIKYIKQHYPAYRLALLTNGMLFPQAEVRKEVLPCDLILPSLDAALQHSFEVINRPLPGFDVHRLIDGLVNLRQEYHGLIWLEVFLIPGINDTETELQALSDAIARIKPNVVQLNSLDRPGTESWVKPLSLKSLQAAQAFMEARVDMPVEIIAKSHHSENPAAVDKQLAEMIINTLQRRPCTAEDLSLSLGVHINEICKLLREMHESGQVSVKRESRGVFYSWKH